MSNVMDFKYDVFLSYSAKEKPLVRKTAPRFNAARGTRLVR
jgi:hypothetical protein